MFDLEPYQYLVILGHVYRLLLLFYAMILLTRRRLWLLQFVFLGGAASYAAYIALAAAGIADPAGPYRILSIYGNSICFHVLLLVIHTLIRSQSLGRLKPFGSDYAP